MSDEEEPEELEPKKKSKALLISLVLGVVLGGGAFFAIYSGMILGAPAPEEEMASEENAKEPLVFVPIEPMTVSLGPRAETLLRFSAQLEVDPYHSDDVANLTPRILDILNGYLRAVDIAELEDPASLIRFRSQMLRRIQLVTGPDHVRDLLITEFVFR